MAIKRTKRTDSRRKYYVLFGFNVEDIDTVGYYSDNGIVEDMCDAKRFKRSTLDKEDWCKFINEDPGLNHGYRFHVVKILGD